MHVTAIVSTKGGVGKTTTAANLVGLAADAGLRVLLLDLDVQPILSSYYTLPARAPAGCYELLAYNESRPSQLICRTAIKGLDLVVSNDAQGQLNTLLLHAPDGRLRLRYLLREELKLNQPQASDAWLTDDALRLVSKTVSDKLRAHLLKHGIEGIPERNTAVFNVLKPYGKRLSPVTVAGRKV